MSKKVSDLALLSRVDAVSNYGCDFVNRRIYIFGEINDEAIVRFLPVFNILDEYKAPITITISSPGGHIEAGLLIYDALMKSPNTITVEAVGDCSSIATIILQAGDVRLVDEHCEFLIHNPQTTYTDSTLHGNEMAASSDQIAKQTQVLYEIYASRSKLPIKQVKGIMDKPSYLSSKEIVDFNLADGILSKHGSK